MNQPIKVDTKEFEVPETTYSHDIETRVIQIIVLHCVNKIEGVFLMGGSLIDTLLGRDVERMKGIYVEQDGKNHTLKVRVEVNIRYGLPIPEKSFEVQESVVGEITRLTGLHVSSVHVIVKGLIMEEEEKRVAEKEQELLQDYPSPLIDEETNHAS